MHVEDIATEFKREYSPTILKTAVAFANTQGGTIYVGIEDDGRVIGLMNIDETMRRISSSIRDGIRPDITMFVDYRIENMDGRDVLAIHIQRGTIRPYYIRDKGLRPEGVYLREGSTSVPASRGAIVHMIKESDGDVFEEMRSLNQELTFEYAQRVFDRAGVPFGDAQKISLGFKGTDGVYSNTGLLFSDQCEHTIKAAVFQGTTRNIFRDRHEFTGSLLAQLNDAYDFLDRYNRTRAEIEGLYRIDRRDYPPVALRESLLNAIIHRDYSYRDSTLISVYDDRVEMVSIGGLLSNYRIEDAMVGVSMLRNRRVANVFYRLEFVEAFGTGVPKIMDSYENERVQPLIATTPNVFRIMLPNLNAEADRLHALRRDGNVRTEETASVVRLDEHHKAVLALIDEHVSMSRSDVQSALEIPRSTASRLLRELVSAGLIQVVGAGRRTRYRRTSES